MPSGTEASQNVYVVVSTTASAKPVVPPWLVPELARKGVPLRMSEAVSVTAQAGSLISSNNKTPICRKYETM